MILDRFRLDGKVAVVTGGNRGLGLAMGAALAEAGADIVSVQHGPEAPELAARVADAGQELLLCAADLAEDTTPKMVLEQTLARFGHVDILVNNAGVQRRAPAVDFSINDWDTVIGINLRIVFQFCQTFGRVLLVQRSGKIINIASLLSFQGGIMVPAYAASKHGIVGLTQALCNEWAGQGVNVNAIAPGYMDTEMNVALKNDPIRNGAISARIPSNRWGTPDDMAGAVVFLASAASDYVHGQTLIVDGGWSAR